MLSSDPQTLVGLGVNSKRKEAFMDNAMKEKFIRLWKKYFDGAELPIVFFYTDNERIAPKVESPKGHRCIITDIARARKGKSLLFGAESVGCFGGKKSLGFPGGIMPNFEYFLSCGIPGKVEGERYKKTPELVKEIVEATPVFKAPSPYIAFKRWDKLDEGDNPEVVIVFGTPDVISGLFTLSNYDEAEPEWCLLSLWRRVCDHPYVPLSGKRCQTSPQRSRHV